MNREEQLTKSMLDMANGAIKERADVEMPKIIKNILDVNTNPTKPRKMTLTLTFTPDGQRRAIAMECGTKLTLSEVYKLPNQMDMFHDDLCGRG